MKDFLLTFSSLKECKLKLNEMFTDNPKGKYRLNLVKWTKKRSISSNGQIHLWFGEIAKFYGDRTALEIKCFCKDAIGLPILLCSESHGDVLEFFLCELDYYRRSHEAKMKLIQFIPVTSEMDTPEIKKFMEEMIFYWNDLGVPIKFKDN